jgi:metallo-beta-lactamase family protein
LNPTILTFYGAARTVTGSCYLLDTGKTRLLVDCGLFQGSKSEKELNYQPFPFDPASIDTVLLTHAHIDHSGALPKLIKAGYPGKIRATKATIDLASVMLPDSGHIQEIEVEHLNRRNARRGRNKVKPIYTRADAAASLSHFQPVPYDEWQSVGEGVRARYWNAGHLLGSASIELEIADGERPLRLLFSGDIGARQKVLEPKPTAPTGLDYVISESTYGDRSRGDVDDAQRQRMLRDEVLAAREAGGALLIPSFAVERTQELVTDLEDLLETGEIPPFPIYVDSPLARAATDVFNRHAGELENGDMLRRALNSPNIHFTETVDDSIALDSIEDFHAVISASGMCEAGRIRYRLKNWLWSNRATVLFVGYQAQGTLGRILLEGADAVRIQGEEITVGARIRMLDVYSGHADREGLERWIRNRQPIERGLFLVHGEEPALEGLSSLVSGFVPEQKIVIPEIDASYRLTETGAERIAPVAPPRITPEHVARLDWHNDLSRLFLDISDAVRHAADERAKGVIIRAMRRALETQQTGQNPP